MRERPSAEVPKAVMSGIRLESNHGFPFESTFGSFFVPTMPYQKPSVPHCAFPKVPSGLPSVPRFLSAHPLAGSSRLQSMGWNEPFSRCTPTQIGTFG